MEQGSSSAKSPSNSSNQRKQSFTDELRAIVNSSSQDLSAEKESRQSIPEASEYRTSNFEGALNFSQSQQIGASFSRAALQEEMQSQNVDLSAAYLHGNLQSRDHQQLYPAIRSNINNPMISSEEAQYYNEMMNRYNLSLSNFPQEFHLLSSSPAHRPLQIGSSQTLVPFESSIIDPSLNTGMHYAYSAPENSVSLRSMRSQGLPYSMNSFDLGIDISNTTKSPTTSVLKAPFESSMNEQLFDVAAQNNASTVEPSLRLARSLGFPYASSSAGPTTSAFKRKMPLQDETPSWNSVGRGLHRYSSSSYDGGRYTLYDKRYEDVGLPVDPHLRIFVATNANGSGESSSRTKD